MATNLPQVKTEICTSCGMCMEACPCHSVDLEHGAPVFSCPEDCATACSEESGCGCVCEDACPEGAISCAFEVVLEPGPARPTCCDPGKPAPCQCKEST